jgi:membrane protease YdiL (CAAX protease family)
MKTLDLSTQDPLAVTGVRPGQVTGWLDRIALAVLFIGAGALIIIVFSAWRPLLGMSADYQARWQDYLGRIGLTAILLAAARLVRRSQRGETYAAILNGLGILTAALSLDWIFGIYLLNRLGVSVAAPQGWSLLKLNELLVMASVIIVGTRLSGTNLGTIYLQQGRLKLGLITGGIAFVLAAAGSVPMASLFNARDLSLARILGWAPWIMLYVLANAAMEELAFRGLFLRRLEPLGGKFLANLLVAIVFTGIHMGATYTADQRMFIAVVFPLALAWGWLMQKTDSVWGSILFHAGMDIPIMLGIFSNL